MGLTLKPAPVVFEEVRHTYTLLSTGKLVPGVTSITKNLDKPWLVSWAAKETVTYLEPRLEEIQACTTKKQYLEILKAAKNAHRRKAATARDHGTLAHNWIEVYIGEKLGLNVPKYPELTPEAESAVMAFREWEWERQITWLASELVVGSETHEYGGKLDALAEIGGAVTLVDWKTSNQISDEYFLQTAGYQIAVEEMGGRVDERLILRIDKRTGAFEAKAVPTPVDLDKSTFLALRQVSRWQSYVGQVAA